MDVIIELLRFRLSISGELRACDVLSPPPAVHYSLPAVNSYSTYSAYTTRLETENRGTVPINLFSKPSHRPYQPLITWEPDKSAGACSWPQPPPNAYVTNERDYFYISPHTSTVCIQT